MTVSKNLPPDLKPYERCEKYGPSVLNDAELLAVILRTGSVGENSVSLAGRLLALGDLGDITRMSHEKLRKIRGIGKVKAMQLLCIGELARRIAGKKRRELPLLDSADRIAEYYMEDLAREKREKVYLLMLNSRFRLLHETLLSLGTVNSAPLSPREVFTEAMRHDASAVVLLHNHPGGDPSPSEEDIRITEILAKAGELVQIPLADHIVIGDHCYISLRESGVLA